MATKPSGPQGRMEMDSNPSISGIDTVNNAAREYIGRGWSVVPVPAGEKGPNLRGWQNLRITPDEVDEWFVGGSNIGLQLGEPGGGLADVDLDCDEAEHTGRALLPRTLTSGTREQDTAFLVHVSRYKVLQIQGR